LRLFAASFLMFFVELALIRWLPEEVIYLSWFANFILLPSFLGIGLGFLRAGKDRDLSILGPIFLGITVMVVLIAPLPESQGPRVGIGDFAAISGLSPWIVLPPIFVAVVVTMAGIGEAVARYFVQLPPLEAYRYDIIGSIAGILVFTGISFVWAPPVVWGVIAAILTIVVYGKRLKIPVVVVLIGMVLTLGVESTRPQFGWSPYYKSNLVPIAFADGQTGYGLSINAIPQQDMIPLNIFQELGRDKPYSALTSYSYLKQPPRTVLIIGAGTGNDVALALAEGATHVDAVEIDPHTQHLGAEKHPSRPYSDPRVSVHIDDGRAFLEQTTQTYDMIIYALPDSLTLISQQSGIRLESYLLTQQAMNTVHDRLAPNGVFNADNYYVYPWLVDRLAKELEVSFGHPPCVDSDRELSTRVIFTVAKKEGEVQCSTVWRPTTAVAEVTSDDWPFPYIETRSIPPLYLVTTLGMLVATALGLVVVGGLRGRQMRRYLDLFFMGGAFLLLETKNIVQFALLFGATWVVNSIVFIGILLAVLAAIEVSRRVVIRRIGIAYGFLLASLAASWIIPSASLLQLPYALRLVVSIVLAFAPIFCANLVFAQRFRSVTDSTVAFATNLLGAMLGGLLESLSLVTGYRTLLILVALFYLASFLARPRLAASQ
jgi:SAM-dependent methyltransferase